MLEYVIGFVVFLVLVYFAYNYYKEASIKASQPLVYPPNPIIKSTEISISGATLPNSTYVPYQPSMMKLARQGMFSPDASRGPIPTSGTKLFQSLMPPPYTGGYTKDTATQYCLKHGGTLAYPNTLNGFSNVGYDSGEAWGWTTLGTAKISQTVSPGGMSHMPGTLPTTLSGVYCTGQPNSSYTGPIFVLP